MPFTTYLILALGLAVAAALRVRHLRRHPTQDCPACSGVGWIPKDSSGSWKRGAKVCRRCGRSGKVTVRVVWLARLVSGQRPRHPSARLVLMPMPDRAGRQSAPDLMGVS